MLRTAIASSPKHAGLHHALGLTRARQRRPDDALAEFRIPHGGPSSKPDRSRCAYVYAVALDSSGRINESMKVLERSLAQHPDDRVTFLALATFSCDAGDIGSALGYAEQLSRINPNDRDLAQFTDELRSRLKQ